MSGGAVERWSGGRRLGGGIHAEASYYWELWSCWLTEEWASDGGDMLTGKWGGLAGRRRISAACWLTTDTTWSPAGLGL